MDHELEQAQIKQEIGPCFRAPSLCVVPLWATGGAVLSALKDVLPCASCRFCVARTSQLYGEEL